MDSSYYIEPYLSTTIHPFGEKVVIVGHIVHDLPAHDETKEVSSWQCCEFGWYFRQAAPICHLESDITVCIPSHKTGPIVAKGLHSCHLEISPTIERAWKTFWECKDDERNNLQDDATGCLKRCHILILIIRMYEKQTVWKTSLPESWKMLSYF